ncbi:unnamed protein product, partial [Schistosoma margrebowiei]
MSEDDQNSKEIVTSYDEILEITGLLAMRDNSMSCVTEKKETPNSMDNINNGDVSNDDIVLPIQSCTQLPLSPSLVSLVEDGGPNCRTISIAKTKNNNVGFTFTEIKQ